MQLFNHMDPKFGGPGFGHHGIWFVGLVPLILWVVLIGVAIWAVLRVTSRHALVATTAPSPAAPRSDAALEEVRLRYARGEMSREEFAQRSRDLGGNPTEPVDRSQSDVD
jgi:putative membrane protein